MTHLRCGKKVLALTINRASYCLPLGKWVCAYGERKGIAIETGKNGQLELKTFFWKSEQRYL